MIRPDSTLSHYLKGFLGDRYILTNATYDHAIEVLERMDIIRLFKKIYARDNTNLLKPSLELANKVNQDIGITGDDTIYFFDDLPQNLWMVIRMGGQLFGSILITRRNICINGSIMDT